MAAHGIINGILINWENGVDRDLAFTEVWRATVDNRASAVLIQSVPVNAPGAFQSWANMGLTGGTTYYYWVRHVNRTGLPSATYYPPSAVAGWSSSALGSGGTSGGGEVTLNTGTNVGLTTPGLMTLGATYTLGATSDHFRVSDLGLGVAAPTGGGQVAQTLGANNVTGTLITRSTDVSPTGKFADYHTAAGASLYSVSITGDVTAKTETLQPLSNGDALVIKNTAGGTTRFSVNTSVGDKIKAGNRLLVDTAAQFFDFGLGGSQIGWVDTTPPAPKAAALLVYSKTLGDSTTTMGGAALQATASDDASVGAGTKGQLIAVRGEVEPLILHDTGANIDDVACFTAENVGTHRGTDAFYFSDRHASMAEGYDWSFGISFAAWCEHAAFVNIGTSGQYGIDFLGPLNTGAGSLSGKIIRVPNNQSYAARNQANGADVPLFKLNTSNVFEVLTTTLVDGTVSVNLNSAAIPATSISPLNLVIAGADTTATTEALLAFGSSPRLALLRANNTAVSLNAVASGDVLGSYVFGGYDGSAWTSSTFPAIIRAAAAESWGGSAHGADLIFMVAATGATSAAQRLRIFASGSLIVGNTVTDPGLAGLLQIHANTTAGPAPPTNTLVHIVQADATATAFTVDTFSGAMDFVGRRARNTNASPLALAANNSIVRLAAQGYNGSAYSDTQASIAMLAASAWTGSNHDTYITFNVTPNASTTLTEAMRIYNSGGISVGSTVQADQGNGTINVQNNIYLAGGAYTNPDFVLEHYFTGAIVRFRSCDGAVEYDGLQSLAAVKAFARQHHVLPRIHEARQRNGGRLGLFDGGDAVLASLEEAYLYIFDLQDRLQRLERLYDGTQS